MKKYTSEYWQLDLPDNWVTETEEEVTVLYDPDGPGTLEISAYENEDIISIDDLGEIAAENIEDEVEAEEISVGDFEGFSFCYSDEDEFLCEWYLSSGKIMLFITYICELDYEGEEDDVVDAILETLTTVE